MEIVLLELEVNELNSTADGKCNLKLENNSVTLQLCLFPYLFPDCLGHYIPGIKASLASFVAYLFRTLYPMSMLFSPFTMTHEYLLMMHQILKVMQCCTSNQKYTLKKAYENRVRKYPNESEQDRVKNLLTYVLSKIVVYSPTWWRHRLYDLKAITREHVQNHAFFIRAILEVFLWVEMREKRIPSR